MDATAQFRHQPNTDRFELVFNYVNQAANINRLFNLQRFLSETTDATFNRMRTNIEKELKKVGGKKKKPIKDATGGSGSGAIQIELITKPSTGLIETWIDFLAFINENTANQAELRIGEQSLRITYNYPYVSLIAMPAMMLVGYDCYPAKFDVVFAERQQCKYQWYRGGVTDDKKDESIEWIECDNGKDFFYTVKSSDFQHKLKVIF